MASRVEISSERFPSGETKVGDDDGVEPLHEYILRFEVTMKHAKLMTMIDRVDELQEDGLDELGVRPVVSSRCNRSKVTSCRDCSEKVAARIKLLR